MVFGISPAAAGDTAKLDSYRRAQSHAAKLADRDDAEQAYRSALMSDDRVLAAAILGRALTEGWRSIIDDHGSRNPTDRTALDDLEQIGKFERNSLMNTMSYMVPRLDVQYSAGFPRLPQTSGGPVRTVPDLADTMSQRLGLS